MDKFVTNPPPLLVKKKVVAIKEQPRPPECNMDKFVKRPPPPPPPPMLMLPPPVVLSETAIKDRRLLLNWKMENQQLYKRYTKDDGNVYILAFDKFFMVWPDQLKTVDRGLIPLEMETIWDDNVKYPLIRHSVAFSK